MSQTHPPPPPARKTSRSKSLHPGDAAAFEAAAIRASEEEEDWQLGAERLAAALRDPANRRRSSLQVDRGFSDRQKMTKLLKVRLRKID